MKGIRISKAIKILEELKRDYGDVELYINKLDDDECTVENIVITEKNGETVVEIW